MEAMYVQKGGNSNMWQYYVESGGAVDVTDEAKEGAGWGNSSQC